MIGHNVQRLILNAYPGCEYIAWSALLGAMQNFPDKRRVFVRTPDGHEFIVKHNVSGYDEPDRKRSWSITQIKDGRDEG